MVTRFRNRALFAQDCTQESLAQRNPVEKRFPFACLPSQSLLEGTGHFARTGAALKRRWPLAVPARENRHHYGAGLIVTCVAWTATSRTQAPATLRSRCMRAARRSRWQRAPTVLACGPAKRNYLTVPVGTGGNVSTPLRGSCRVVRCRPPLALCLVCDTD
jgi:hypothetical protein